MLLKCHRHDNGSRSGANVVIAQVRPRKHEIACVESSFRESSGNVGYSKGATQPVFLNGLGPGPSEMLLSLFIGTSLRPAGKDLTLDSLLATMENADNETTFRVAE